MTAADALSELLRRFAAEHDMTLTEVREAVTEALRDSRWRFDELPDVQKSAPADKYDRFDPYWKHY